MNNKQPYRPGAGAGAYATSLHSADMYADDVPEAMLQSSSGRVFHYNRPNAIAPMSSMRMENISTTTHDTEPVQGIVHRAVYEQSLAAPKRSSKKKPPFGMRKPCNCTKSLCLKLYCDCFANGEFCRDCNCKDCHNNMDYEAERTRAIRQSLERNPNAFKPKIGVASKGQTDPERLHQKGCHCKKSSCLKNYCECYEAKVACTDRCKCIACKNTEADRASKSSMSNQQYSSNQPQACNAGNAAHLSDEESEAGDGVAPKTMPWYYLRDEVVEAAATCLITTGEEQQNENADDEMIEYMLLAEFSKIIQNIITKCELSQEGIDAEQV